MLCVPQAWQTQRRNFRGPRAWLIHVHVRTQETGDADAPVQQRYVKPLSFQPPPSKNVPAIVNRDRKTARKIFPPMLLYWWVLHSNWNLIILMCTVWVRELNLNAPRHCQFYNNQSPLLLKKANYHSSHFFLLTLTRTQVTIELFARLFFVFTFICCLRSIASSLMSLNGCSRYW